jgi:hypothetical protein
MSTYEHPSPDFTAFTTAQQNAVRELHNAIARGRNTITQSIKDAEGQTHNQVDYLKLYRQQLGVLDMWEKNFDSVWKQMEYVRPWQKAEFLASKEQGLRNLVENFRERMEGIRMKGGGVDVGETGP